MTRFNSEKYESTIKSLVEIKRNISISNHDRMSVDSDSDYEPSSEEVEGWLKHMNLPPPSESQYSIVYELPFDYWRDIFGEANEEGTLLSEEEKFEIKDSKPYLELFKLYSSAYEELYQACKEESAYYSNEYDEQEKDYDLMRGFL